MNWIFLTYACLYLTVISLWFPNAKNSLYWTSAFFIFIFLGLITNVLEPIALIPIFILAGSVYCCTIPQRATNYVIKVSATLIVVGVCSGLALHAFPGFHNLIAFKNIYFSPDAIPYTLNLNSDKAVMGILSLGISHSLIPSSKEWRQLLKQLPIYLLLFVSLIIIISLLLGFARFDPKLPRETLVWAVTNLLFVCVAEEAFFRGFIQKNMSVMLAKFSNGRYWAIFIASVLFGLAHFAGGIKYVMLATVAGLGYGWVYYATRRIEASIITHFTLNLTHFLFFTYPALAGSI